MSVQKWQEIARRTTLEIRNVIDGKIIETSSGALIEKRGPRDGRVLYRFASSASADVDRAVAAARQSLQDRRWTGLSHEHRRTILHNFANLIDREAEQLALLETLDVGKPIADSIGGDVRRLVSAVRFCANAADKVRGTLYGSSPSNLSYDLRRPVGVVGAIVGWNYPLVLAGTKIAPALAMGNSLVLKPSEMTSLSTWRLAELAIEAGVPDGVFNVVNGGHQVGVAIAEHPDIDLVTFTGSSATGKALLSASGRTNMKRLILECGGKSPEIVFDDTPSLEAAAAGIVARAFRNQGQLCTASSRVLVQAGVAKPLLDLIVEKCAGIRPGDPLDPHTRFGALVSAEHRDKVRSFVDAGLRDGAQLAYQCQAQGPFPSGNYLGPTVFTHLNPASLIATEEIFGPVLCVLPFAAEDQAIGLANSTPYGLSAVVWTSDIGRAQRMTHRIDAGIVVVNATSRPSGPPSAEILSAEPHGQSGWGVEGGIEGLAAYTRGTTVQLNV